MSGNLFLAAETSGKVLRTNSLKGPFSQTLNVARLSFKFKSYSLFPCDYMILINDSVCVKQLQLKELTSG